MGLPNLSVNRPVAILMVFCAVIIIGVISLLRLPIELLPNFSFGDISIFIDIRGGIPPEEVESQVSKPTEDAVGSVSHLRELMSISEEGRSRVVMRFEPGINMNYAALEVKEKFSRIRNKLPPQIEKPVIAKFEQQDVPILITAVTGGVNYTPEMLRKIVDETIKEQILRVEGVANVEIGGGRERKILVEVDQKKLQAYKLPIGKVINVLNLNNLNLLLGELPQKKHKYLIRVIGGFKSIDDIKNIGVATTPSGSVIKVADVADVKDSYLEATSYARVNVLPVVSLYIQKESQANTVEVIRRIQEAKKKLTSGVLDKRIRLIDTYNQAITIMQAIDNVKTTLLYGAFLAIAVLWFFLRDMRSTFIIAVSIPISVIGTFILMFFQKITLNVMTLSGLAIGVGMLVDNSIVVLENIATLKEKGLDKIKASINGCEEMFLAMVASTITTVVVFLPIIFVSNEIRILYSGIAFTVTYSLLVSLAVAISLVPMLSAHLPSMALIKKHKTRKPQRLVLKFFRSRYRMLLGWSIRLRYILLAAAFCIFVVSIYIIAFKIDKEFVGTTEQQDFTIFIELPTGAKLDISDKAVKGVEEMLSTIPEVKQFSSRVEKWSSKVYVKLLPLSERTRSIKDIIEDLRTKVADIEKQYREAFIYFEEPQEVETNEIIVEIFGYDYKILNELAIAMLTRMQSVQGLVDLKIRWRKGRPEWWVKVDRKKAAMYGFTVDEIANTLHAQMRGLRATLYHTQGKEVEVIARLQEKDRRTLDALRKLTMTKQDGLSICLEQVAIFEPDVGPSKIWRKNKSRMIQISANRGRLAFGTAAEKIKKALSDVKMPKDYYYNFGENYWKMIRNQRELSFAIVLTIILIYLVLASLFESYVQPFIIMITVPLAAIGVAIALKVSHKTINIGMLMGCIMLGGIVVNNAIILIDYINRLKEKNIKSLRAILIACEGRLRPIMMTTSTTLLGLWPMAMDRSEQANLWSPLAITVMGGLASSSILTLFIIPGVYLIFDDIKNKFFIKKVKPS
ncbi:MAG: efflux RND transporter permease subunit [Candidatus Omnitrophica bacterium]|nr:efflux RND transporter permease subunit [Candidatus Omnitrophota bacterium]